MKQIFKKSISLLLVLTIMAVGKFFNTQIGTFANAGIADASCSNQLKNIFDSRNSVVTSCTDKTTTVLNVQVAGVELSLVD